MSIFATLPEKQMIRCQLLRKNNCTFQAAAASCASAVFFFSIKQQTTTPFSKEVVVFLWDLFLRKDKLCKIPHGTALSLIIAFYFLEEAFGDLPQLQILCNTGRAALLVVGWMMGTVPIGAGTKIA
jgi:hypothetical protein